jgi:hypothetical protein
MLGLPGQIKHRHDCSILFHATWLDLRADVAFGWQFVEVTARFHPFVQHADDLDHAFLGDAIVENVNRSPDLRAFTKMACVSDMEAADTGTKVRSLLGERTSGSAATCRIAAARTAVSRRRPSAPQRLL